jgi:uncharacterized membrane protein
VLVDVPTNRISLLPNRQLPGPLIARRNFLPARRMVCSFSRQVSTTATLNGVPTMTTGTHLWAIGYDSPTRAHEVREEIFRLGWGNGTVETHFVLLDVAVVVRHADGTFTFDRQPFPAAANILGCSLVGFLAGLVLAAPLTGAAVGALVGGLGTATSAGAAGIGADFVREVEGLMKPGTSALFVLDDEGDMEMILHALRSLGGTVLKTNVDPERAKLIQSTLAVGSTATSG